MESFKSLSQRRLNELALKAGKQFLQELKNSLKNSQLSMPPATNVPDEDQSLKILTELLSSSSTIPPQHQCSCSCSSRASNAPPNINDRIIPCSSGLSEKLKLWAIEQKMNFKQLNNLLKILREANDEMPKDAHTLRSTSQNDTNCVETEPAEGLFVLKDGQLHLNVKCENNSVDVDDDSDDEETESRPNKKIKLGSNNCIQDESINKTKDLDLPPMTAEINKNSGGSLNLIKLQNRMLLEGNEQSFSQVSEALQEQMKNLKEDVAELKSVMVTHNNTLNDIKNLLESYIVASKRDNVELKYSIENSMPVQQTINNACDVAGLINDRMPISATEELVAFQNLLREDPLFMLAFEKWITDIGGSCGRKHIANVFSSLLTLDLQKNINWSGAHQKIKLKDTILFHTIINTVTSVHEGYSKDEATSNTKYFFQHTYDRLKVQKT